jgi:hypothetical protein
MPRKDTSIYGPVFGLIIAVVLLLLYSITMGFLIYEVLANQSDANMSDGAIYILTTVGGLVAALVIAVLAITEPGRNPADQVRKMFAPVAPAAAPDDQTNKGAANWLVGLYLGIWLVVGLTALIVGVMIYPEASTTLRDIGTTWLGLAVASAYAYFGIQPK